MKKLVIKSHSFLDVITNSSTELFMCNTDKSLEVIQGILQNILDDWNKENYLEALSYEDGRVSNELFYQDTFHVYIYTKEIHEKDSEYPSCNWGYEQVSNIGNIIIEGRNDNIIPYEIWDKINEIFDAQNYHLG